MKTEWTLFFLSAALFGVAFLGGGCASPVAPVASSAVPHEEADRLARQVAVQIGGTTWRVAGTSMLPMLPDRCILVAEAVDFEQLRAGDVVVYSNRHLRPIIHRLVERRGEGWRVKGDALAWADDDLVTRTNFLGRQCAIFFTQ